MTLSRRTFIATASAAAVTPAPVTNQSYLQQMAAKYGDAFDKLVIWDRETGSWTLLATASDMAILDARAKNFRLHGKLIPDFHMMKLDP